MSNFYGPEGEWQINQPESMRRELFFEAEIDYSPWIDSNV